MKRYAIPIIFVTVAAAFCVWWFSPTQVIKRRTASLLTTLTLGAGDGKANRHMGAFSLNGLLAPQVQLETPTIDEANGTFEREELESAFTWLCDQAKQTSFKMEELRGITISGDKAQVKLTLTGLVELPTYKPADGSYDVTFDWVKEKDGWRLTHAVWDKVP
ncbi:MAG: hypothetical protein ABIS50_13110 [Luteolibacter sp.]|uniref:hypothetical protein n=1 Tax=Luteolibacter sp. TaxID=1962973 RepID=UPI0032660CC1